MKKSLLLVTGFLGWSVLVLVSCSSKTDSPPCNNKGTLCIENKLDTDVTITLKPVHDQFQLKKDYMKCSELDGNKAYTVTVTTTYSQRDTTLMILPCDNKLLVIR
jgi:hypothetical protein